MKLRGDRRLGLFISVQGETYRKDPNGSYHVDQEQNASR
jgi:hypothetical protein